MSDTSPIASGLRSLADVARQTADQSAALGPIVDAMRACLQRGGTLFFMGNGGSAADAQHIAAEYVVRIGPEQRRALRAQALTTDSSILTAAANDFGFETVFSRQLEAVGRPGDVVVIHSTSGKSPNILAAARTARAMGIESVALLGGDGGAARTLVDHAFVVPSQHVATVQEIHLAVQHRIAALLTAEFAG